MTHSDRLEKLIKAHQSSLYRAALNLTRNRQDAEDAVQEAYLRYLEKRPLLLGDASERAWLMRVCLNVCMDGLRERSRHPREELLDIYPAPDAPTRELVDAVGALPPNERAAIHLFYYEGYSTEQIAKILSCRPGTARSYLSRARDNLRQELKGEIDL